MTDKIELELLDKLNAKNQYIWDQAKSTPEIRHWLANFEKEDKEIALTLALGIKYYSDKLIKSSLVSLSKKIVNYIYKKDKELQNSLNGKNEIEEIRKIIDDFIYKNCLFIGYGSGSSSGTMLLYHYDKHLDFSRINTCSICELFHDDRFQSEKYKYIFFIDDFIGTGDQAADTWEEQICGKTLKDYATNNPYKRLILAVLVSTKDGINKVSSKINSYENKFLDIISNDIINEKLYSFSEESLVFRNATLRQKAKERLSLYGEKLSKRFPLGYNEMGLTISFSHNTPDNSLPVIWKKSENWQPLFERYKK